MTISKENIGYELCTIARFIHQFLTKELKSFDITPEQWIILKTLLEHEGISQKNIANYIQKDSNNTKAIIDKLENKGLIKKIQNIKDKRAFSLLVTEKGKTLSKELIEIDNNMLSQLSNSLSKSDFIHLNKIFFKLKQNINI